MHGGRVFGIRIGNWLTDFGLGSFWRLGPRLFGLFRRTIITLFLFLILFLLTQVCLAVLARHGIGMYRLFALSLCFGLAIGDIRTTLDLVFGFLLFLVFLLLC